MEDDKLTLETLLEAKERLIEESNVQLRLNKALPDYSFLSYQINGHYADWIYWNSTQTAFAERHTNHVCKLCQGEGSVKVEPKLRTKQPHLAPKELKPCPKCHPKNKKP